MTTAPSGSSSTTRRTSRSLPGARIEITAFPGRSTEAKQNLYRALVQRLGEIAIDPMDVSVVIIEPTLESWGVRGGHSAADVDLGFSLDV